MGYLIIEDNGLFGLKNSNGDILLDVKYHEIVSDSHFGFIVMKNGKYGYFSNYSNRLILKPAFQKIRNLNIIQLMKSEINRIPRTLSLYIHTITLFNMKKGVSYNFIEFTFGENYGLIHLQSGNNIGIFEMGQTSGLLPFTFNSNEIDFVYTIDGKYMNIFDQYGQNCIPKDKYFHTEKFIGKKALLESIDGFDYFDRSFQKLNSLPIKECINSGQLKVILVKMEKYWEIRNRNFKLIKIFDKNVTKKPIVFEGKIFICTKTGICIYNNHGLLEEETPYKILKEVKAHYQKSLLVLSSNTTCKIYSFYSGKFLLNEKLEIIQIKHCSIDRYLFSIDLLTIESDEVSVNIYKCPDGKTLKHVFNGTISDLSIDSFDKNNIKIKVKERGTFIIPISKFKTSSALTKYFQNLGKNPI